MIRHVKCYKENYPRPQFVRNEWLNLNGSWDFAFDDENSGEDNKWYINFPKQTEIIVPFVYQTKASHIHLEEQHQNVWYRKEVTFPKKKRILLNFEGCDYTTKVWINGNFIGVHQGAYTRFSFDITRFVIDGINTIVVKAEDSYNTCQPRGKQRWKDANFGCWYVDTTGIWKTVWCEFVEDNYLEKVKITPDFNNFTTQFDVTVNSADKGLSLETRIYFKDEFVSSNETVIVRNNFTTTLDCMNVNDQFKMYTYSMHNPDLYDVEFILKKDGKVVDEVGSYFGFRKLDAKNKAINFNDQPIYLKMLLDQGYFEESGITPVSEEAIIKDILLTKEMGFNGIRKHQKIEDERFYYYCDILGVLVWCEMPSTYEYKDETVLNFTKEWLDVVEQHYNHPSIITWVPFNESWGVPRVKSLYRQQKFTEGIYYLTKAIDDTRFVISNDGWEHTKSDIITLHNYAEFGEGLLGYKNDMTKVLSNEYVNGMHQKYAFADGYKYEGQPILISEYAGIAFEKDENKGWGYGHKVKDSNAFLYRLKSLTDAIFEMHDVCGYCVTQTTDVEQEVNGLLTSNREPKVAIAEIKKINDKK